MIMIPICSTIQLLLLETFNFRACIGIFLTTFTLEEELSLKAQTQKLLTVAKNLFTHLG